ncbi:MAG: amino acid adenylation domain-containing protein [bacterium]|nr:amino acid adenylation domain-containing protein [bacterium]
MNIKLLDNNFKEVNIHSLFEHVAAEHGNQTAVIIDQKSISYADLNEKSNKLAQVIRNIAPNFPIIGVSANRSIEMIIGILAILKSGKAYLPLDTTYPEERLNQIISDSRIEFYVGSTIAKDKLLFNRLGLSEIEEQQSFVDKTSSINNDLAYVLYTSGSTGKPKGVAMGHFALVNLLIWQSENSKATLNTKTLQFAPLSFDVSFQEIFSTLTTGGTIVLIDDKLRLDPLKVLAIIEEHKIQRIFLPFIALQYLAEMAVSFNQYPNCLKEVITAGEQLKITPQIVHFFNHLDNCSLSNQYGPTECHVVSEKLLTGNANLWPLLPNIGKPINQTDIYILDENLKLIEDGSEGELCIAGICLANGYLYNEELTEQKFINWSHPVKGLIKLYKTGDLAKIIQNDEIEFLGRKDDQVKIRGNRIELGEIEVVISKQKNIKQVAVIAREDIPGQKMLVAYLISSVLERDLTELKKALLNSLPEYMMPSSFVWLNEFPKTTSGKVDRKMLPKPEYLRPELGTLYKKPSSIIEKNISSIWSEILQIDKIGIYDNFFELGGNSLLAQKAVSFLKLKFNYDLPITKLYQFPTISGISLFLSPENQSIIKNRKHTKISGNSSDIAIISMAGRFPGAPTIEALWEILKQGQETIKFFTKEELDSHIPDSIKNDADYVSARGIIEDADKFDAAFFGINSKLAALMDPQQRIFLEITWEVLEKAGYLPQKYDGLIGVYAGSGNNTYYINNVHSNKKLIDQVGGFQVMSVNEKDYVASRTAYELNLKGPAVSVYSGCSTSLLAVSQAVESIRNGQCDIAVAGGVSVTVPIYSGQIYQEGAMFSSDGHCRPFDDSASGTVFSDGAGVVLLKNLESAINDGDTIYGVIKGVGVNNDGSGKGSFTAPSAVGQSGAIGMALQNANIEPSTIQYIETHGTATPLGDPIEIEGLNLAFGNQIKNQFCAIGSVKGNIGHLTAAAGVTGLIKTALSLHHKILPPSIGYNKPNRHIDFENSPFYVNNKLSDWKSESIRRAGVSSFGVGGTNVHIVLEEYQNKQFTSDPSSGYQLISWSAKSAESKERFARILAEQLRNSKHLNIADVAYTLQNFRADFNHRRFVVASSSEDFINQLLLENVSGADSKVLNEAPDEIVFTFPGQGAQYINMGFELYQNEIEYKNTIDYCAAILEKYLGLDIRSIIYSTSNDASSEELLKNTKFTQPAIFITEYALSKLWMSWGIQPSVFCGHSIGEFVGACLAGVFSLEDALQLIATRGILVSQLPSGSMLSVRMEADDLIQIIPKNISIAAVNSKKLCVVAGHDEEIAMFSKKLDGLEIPNRVLVTSHAFHSSMMDPAVIEFKKTISKVKLNRPNKPIISTVTGTWMKDVEALNPEYWANHLRKTVLFSQALDTILTFENPLILEVGPGNVTATLARQQFGSKKINVFYSLERSESKTERYTILKALGNLWLCGLQPNWNAFYSNQNRIKLNLPTYSFDKKKLWVEPIDNVDLNIYNTEIKNNYIFEESSQIETSSIKTTETMRKEKLFKKILELLEDASGLEMSNVSPNMSFLEIGLDSLLLTQVAITFKKEFGLPITFRQLNESYATPERLIEYLDSNLPKEDTIQTHANNNNVQVNNVQQLNSNDSAIGLIAQQIQMLSNQVALLQNGNSKIASHHISNPINSNNNSANFNGLSPEEVEEIKKPFGATARIEKQKVELNPKQSDFLREFTNEYNKKTIKSKQYAQKNRMTMADPRVVSGFRPLTKEIVYPIVVNKSKGTRLWDIDGNEYIDALNGFGSSMLGHQPEIIKNALLEQIENGYEVGPQHELAGEVCDLICELTGQDRAALCSTGSEAVLGTMRIARTVTGRSLIVAFNGSYHGIVDEVIVRGTKKLKSFPAAPGIMPEAVQNMLILDYGTEESLKIIRERAHELAAVLVEPIQSRRPEFVPIEFLKEVRKITTESGTALIFDEVITGFRMHPGGAQALFGIKADLASYGKVVGAGIPIGVIAGKKDFMDALDGGHWQYEDDSYPEIGVTYFAGTFVRHPLALAAAKASLNYMKLKGGDLQNQMTAKTDILAKALNEAFEKYKLPIFVAHYGSLWKVKYKEEIPYSELLFSLLRFEGIHIWDGFPCFITEAHTEVEIQTIIKMFEKSIQTLINSRFYPTNTIEPTHVSLSAMNPPVPGAKLGRDRNGDPAWFISDPNQPGKFLQLNITQI